MSEPYREAADIAADIPKKPWRAPRWLGPLLLLLTCSVAAGGSVDVAIRTGYWGLCSGVAVAAVTLFICGIVIFNGSSETGSNDR